MVVDEGVAIEEDGMLLCRSGWEIYVKAHESENCGFTGGVRILGDRFAVGGNGVFRDGLVCGKWRLWFGWQFCDGCWRFCNRARYYGAGLGLALNVRAFFFLVEVIKVKKVMEVVVEVIVKVFLGIL